MNVRTRIYLAAASAAMIGIVITATLGGAFFATRQNSTFTLTTFCGICFTVNIAAMTVTILFVRFNMRATAHQLAKIAEIAQAAGAELKETGLITTEGKTEDEPIQDLGSMVMLLSIALKKKNDRVFYLENKIKHLTGHSKDTR